MRSDWPDCFGMLILGYSSLTLLLTHNRWVFPAVNCTDTDNRTCCVHACVLQADAEADLNKDDSTSWARGDVVASFKPADQTTAAQETDGQRASERTGHPVFLRYLLLSYFIIVVIDIVIVIIPVVRSEHRCIP